MFEVELLNFASSKVEGMEIGFILSLKTVEGSLTVSLLECGCYVSYVSIELDGGASWLYQRYLFFFSIFVFSFPKFEELWIFSLVPPSAAHVIFILL